MAIVVERINQIKNPPPIMDQMTGKQPEKRPVPQTLQAQAALGQKDLNADLVNQVGNNQGFFGSFFKGGKPSRPGTLEAVSLLQ